MISELKKILRNNAAESWAYPHIERLLKRLTEPKLLIEPVANTSGDDSFKIQSGRLPTFPFDDDFIYACNYQESKIALFNRKTKTIEWVQPLDTQNGAIIIDMKVDGSRWMIWDYGNNLHIMSGQSSGIIAKL